MRCMFSHIKRSCGLANTVVHGRVISSKFEIGGIDKCLGECKHALTQIYIKKQIEKTEKNTLSQGGGCHLSTVFFYPQLGEGC